MGRKRKHRKDLPERLYYRNGAFYFASRKDGWYWLSRDITTALKKYADLTSAPISGTLSGIMDRYIKEVFPTKAKRTQENNEREIENLRKVFGRMEPDEITPQDIYGYMDRRSKISANREVALLSSIFKYSIRWGFCSINPCKSVSRNPESPSNRYVEKNEYEKVYKLAPDVIQCSMDLARITGLRLSDILGLNERNLTEDGIYIETGKTKKKLLIEWTEELKIVVKRARSLRSPVISFYVISNREGQKYTLSGFESLWQRVMKKSVGSGVARFRFHDLRAMASDNAPNPSELLGHDDPKITNRIYRRGPRRVKPAKY